MQILVISDTHGRSDRLRKAVLMHRDADYIVHCGDGEQETDRLLREFPALAPKLYFVRGNCDFSSRSPELLTLDLPYGHRAVIVHQHGLSEQVDVFFGELRCRPDMGRLLPQHPQRHAHLSPA